MSLSCMFVDSDFPWVRRCGRRLEVLWSKLPPAPRASRLEATYGYKGFLSVGASDALIKLDHRMQNWRAVGSYPRSQRLGQHQS